MNGMLIELRASQVWVWACQPHSCIQDYLAAPGLHPFHASSLSCPLSPRGGNPGVGCLMAPNASRKGSKRLPMENHCLKFAHLRRHVENNWFKLRASNFPGSLDTTILKTQRGAAGFQPVHRPKRNCSEPGVLQLLPSSPRDFPVSPQPLSDRAMCTYMLGTSVGSGCLSRGAPGAAKIEATMSLPRKQTQFSLPA